MHCVGQLLTLSPHTPPVYTFFVKFVQDPRSIVIRSMSTIDYPISCAEESQKAQMGMWPIKGSEPNVVIFQKQMQVDRLKTRLLEFCDNITHLISTNRVFGTRPLVAVASGPFAIIRLSVYVHKLVLIT